MKKACLKDSVALIELASEMEEGMAKGDKWNEIKVSKRLLELRSQQKHYKSQSFGTISAYGSNAAIIHYRSHSSNLEVKKQKQKCGLNLRLPRQGPCKELPNKPLQMLLLALRLKILKALD